MRHLLASLVVVFRKELIDGVRDRRSIMSAVIAPVVWPLMIGVMLNVMADKQRLADNIKVPVVGAEHAPALIDWMEQQRGIEIVDGPEEPHVEVREGEFDFVVVIPEDFGEHFSRSKTAEVKMIIDGSERDAQPVVRRVRRLIQGYGEQIAVLRLIARGVSPAVAAPVRIDEVEVSSAQKRAAMVLSFLPMMVVLAVFIGGMQIAIDSTAGERERGSLEPLLVNPAPRFSFVAGKCLASVVFAWASVALTFALLVMVLERAPLQGLGMWFELGPREIVGVLAAVLPLGFFASAVQMWVATFARSYKEAQTYVSFLMFLPMVPALVLILSPVEPAAWMIPIPLVDQHVLVTEALEGGVMSPLSFAAAGLSAAGAALLFLLFTTRLFRREKIIFGR